MIERADQLVLEYVSRAADAAHGVLPPRQRIDFVGRLRKRIDAERTGAEGPEAVAKVLARFGDPAALVRREVRRLEGETPSGGVPETPGETGGAAEAVVPAPTPGSLTESLGEADRPAGVVVPAPASGLHDSAEPSSGRPASGESGSEWLDFPEASTGNPRRSHPYGAAPGAHHSGAGAPGSPAHEGTHDDAHEAVSADVPGPVPTGAPEPAARPRSSPIASGGDGPDDPAAEGVDANDPPTEEIPPTRDVVSQPETGPGPDERTGSVPAPRPGEGSGEGEGPKGATGSGRPRSVTPPGVAKARQEAERLLARKQARKQARRRFNLPRRKHRQPRSREDVVAGESDARTVLLGHHREVVGMALLGLAGLLIPFPFAPIAIFQIPVLVWAVAALVVVFCEAWENVDKVRGIGAPILSYTIGGSLVALIRAREDLGLVVEQFFTISGFMFMMGSAAGVFWLAYRLFNPVTPTGRRNG
ncbi:hypothetical protein [Streptosporangium lutulentum]|uniref:Uncharacterized protein n=1 Tax=Streptosporangium lutulentum TaxID=1461250 RepID=A0ABT9QNZ2_9ACTN|nr:hypothetical protein [Streptosporangium lutulentum]MDP9848492.1 hypothetical protein [Streptosporangium lutulentum]